MNPRRRFFQTLAGMGAGAIAASASAGAAVAKRRPGVAPMAVETPDLPPLPWQFVNGAKEFHLVAEPVKRILAPGREMQVWGYNGTSPGPAIQVTQGDRVRVIFDNHLPEPTSIHWHGLEIPVAMDGMPSISQTLVAPGKRFVYEFTLHQAGTFFYHSHGAMQEMMGMIGMFIIHPKEAWAPAVDHDYGIVLQEWALLPNSNVPNTANMEFNWLTFNGKAGPDTTPLLARLGSRVRVRLVNLGMDHHPIHLHGHTFSITGTEAGRQPEAVWGTGNTVLVGVAQARDVEFVANNPGDWMLHCHLPHHMMNNMSDLIGDRMMTTMRVDADGAMQQMQAFSQAVGVGHPHHAMPPEQAAATPGFPQDAFMEMPMDQAVARPENYGLPANWSSGMMGMMTLMRVLPDELYEKIMAMKAHGASPEEMKKEEAGHEHPHS